MKIVLYDRDCGFCRWCMSKLLAWDRRGRLRPLALQEVEARKLLPNLDEEERMASWHLVDDGEVRSGGRAFSPLFRELPGGGLPARLVEAVPGVVDRAYRWVSDHRSLFGRMLSSGARRRATDRIDARTAP